jgi:hypothetical protein
MFGFGESDLRLLILSEAKLQRSGRSPRGQAFHLGSTLGAMPWQEKPEMFRFAQHDSGI